MKRYISVATCALGALNEKDYQLLKRADLECFCMA
jgi:hypothetical protein